MSPSTVPDIKRFGITLLTLCSITPLYGADWPQFLGPDGQGHAEGVNIPLEWSPEDSVAWKVKLPGKAWSSTMVVDDRVGVTSAVDSGKGLSLRALARSVADGRALWDQAILAIPGDGVFTRRTAMLLRLRSL